MKRLITSTALGMMLFPCAGIAEPVHPARLGAQEAVLPSAPQVKSDDAAAMKAAPIDRTAETKPVAENGDNAANDIHPGPVRRIVIDPGHGGPNEGAVGVAQIHEKHLTLGVALLLADRLRKEMPDTEIIMTRTRDDSSSLGERIDIANRAHADLFLSLHFNCSNNPEAVGFESFWAGQFWASDMIRDGVEITDEIRAQRERAGALGERMAQSFNRAMRRRFDVLDRGVKPGDYTVLTRAEVPAVVIEMGFLSHAQEGMSLVTTNHRAKLVDALVDAVLRYAQ